MNTTQRSLLCSTAIAALALVGAHGAQAQTAVLGGGSTLAALTYDTEFGISSNGSNFTYCSVGSGAGTSAFVSNTDTPLQADAVNCNGVTGTVDYGASDAYISSTNLSYFAANQSAGGALIQIPMFGTPVTFALSTSTATSDGSQVLTDAQLCGIYSGVITDWHTIDPVHFVTGSTITVGYRADSSGTSFLLTSHLKAVCPASTNTPATGFTSTQLAAMPTNTFQTSLFPSGAPSNFVAGTGSSGVLAVVQNNTNAIGYLSPDYTHISSNGANAGYPYVAAVTNSNNSTSYTPTTANTATAFGTLTVPTGTNESNQNNWAPPLYNSSLTNPSSGYPVVGFTYWILPTCYKSGSVATDVITFLKDHFNVSGSTGSFVTAITNSGFVPVPGSSSSAAPTSGSYAAAINAAFLTGSDGEKLNISKVGTGSTNSTCTSLTGR